MSDKWTYEQQPATPGRDCKDCKGTASQGRRPAPYPGPRCATHHRRVKRDRKVAAHDRKVQVTYGLNPGEYDALYRAQGGRCYICQRAKGTGRRKLAVDHDHRTGEVRGLLCSTCNQFIGQVRDNPAAGERLAEYLRNPPARAVLRNDLDDEPVAAARV